MFIFRVCGGRNYLHRQDWPLITKGISTKQVRQNAILGGMLIVQIPARDIFCIFHSNFFLRSTSQQCDSNSIEFNLFFELS